jgi:hypothetical protein
VFPSNPNTVSLSSRFNGNPNNIIFPHDIMAYVYNTIGGPNANATVSYQQINSFADWASQVNDAAQYLRSNFQRVAMPGNPSVLERSDMAMLQGGNPIGFTEAALFAGSYPDTPWNGAPRMPQAYSLNNNMPGGMFSSSGMYPGGMGMFPATQTPGMMVPNGSFGNSYGVALGAPQNGPM